MKRTSNWRDGQTRYGVRRGIQYGVNERHEAQCEFRTLTF
jgi:hypothetical protein